MIKLSKARNDSRSNFIKSSVSLTFVTVWSQKYLILERVRREIKVKCKQRSFMSVTFYLEQQQSQNRTREGRVRVRWLRVNVPGAVSSLSAGGIVVFGSDSCSVRGGGRRGHSEAWRLLVLQSRSASFFNPGPEPQPKQNVTLLDVLCSRQQ